MIYSTLHFVHEKRFLLLGNNGAYIFIIFVAAVTKPTTKPTTRPKSPVHLSKGKPAWQSSIYAARWATKAVDWNRNSDSSQGSCSSTTENDEGPWWMVDLQSEYVITSVQITNRDSNCKLINPTCIHIRLFG